MDVTVHPERYARQTGLLVASGVAPISFARSLSRRSALDQGVITGLATTLSYTLTVISQETLSAIALSGAEESSPAAKRARLLVTDLAAIPAGLAIQRLLPAHEDEPLIRSLVRQAGWRTTLTGLGSLMFAGVDDAVSAIDARVGARGRLSRFPLAVPAGFALAAAIEWQRRRGLASLPTEPEAEETANASLIQSIGTSAAVTGGLSLLTLGEEAVARLLGDVLSARLPGSARHWRLVGHATVLSALAAGVSTLWTRAMQKIEAGTTSFEPLLDDEAGHRWTESSSSGHESSLVPWATLGREGRRHAIALVRPHTVEPRPSGIPDLSIATITKQPARATPIQVYVGLDSAPTATERVQLALDEMDRTGAWDRSLLMLVSPTGTGYVNYCAVAAAQYLTLGDIASVTLQYSKRPSPLSLGKVASAREQNRLLWLRIAQRVRELPADRRPRVVLFGESLGAHTSQDAFIHWGTLGPQALGIDRALWIGTPYSSRWMQQVTIGGRPDVDPDLVAVVNDFGQVEEMGEERRRELRYVLVSHDNDGVTKFGADLLAKAPRWLGPDRPAVEHVPPYSPRGISPAMRWRPITTFFQILVDMKNAQVPGAFRASGHDYRPDLTRFVNGVYDLGATEDELLRAEAALELRESILEKALAEQAFPDAVPTPATP
jgi:uncharacterized membrane protein